MKTLRIVLPALLLVLFSCANAQIKSTDNVSSVVSDNIEVYYFHYERRCVTCSTVEKVTEESLKKNFPEELKNKTLVFQSINLDDKTNDALAEKLKITGQSLLIVKGEKSKDLTNKAFMYAVNQPDKLEQEIKNTINSL